MLLSIFFFQAEDGIRDLVRSRGLGDVYKRQQQHAVHAGLLGHLAALAGGGCAPAARHRPQRLVACLLYTSDAADERSSVDLGGRRIIKKKNNGRTTGERITDKKSHECHKQTTDS